MAWLPYLLLGGLCLYFFSHLLRKESFPFHARGTLLSDAELDFFHVLECALPDQVVIAPKVRLGDVIGCSEADWQAGHGPKISAKHLDFVLFDRRTGRICGAIELDDRTHDRPDRQQRDRFLHQALTAAGVPLLRWPVARSYNQAALSEAVARLAALPDGKA